MARGANKCHHTVLATLKVLDMRLQDDVSRRYLLQQLLLKANRDRSHLTDSDTAEVSTMHSY